MTLKTTKQTLHFKNEKVEVVSQYYLCEESGEEFETEEMVDNSLNQVYDVYKTHFVFPGRD